MPTAIKIGESVPISFIVRNLKGEEYEDIKVVFNIDGFEKYFIDDYGPYESKTYEFTFPASELYVLPNNYYYAYVKVYDKNGNLINQDYKVVFVKSGEAHFYDVELEDDYNADEPIVYSFCLENPTEPYVYVWVDDMLMETHYIPNYEAVQTYCIKNHEIGNIFSNGTHIFKLENDGFVYTQEFSVHFYIKIGEVIMPEELYEDEENIIPVVIETQIPSAVYIYVIEDGVKVRGAVSGYVADRETFYLPYTPSSAGTHDLRIYAVLESNGKKAVRDITDVVVSESSLGFFSSIF